jgi:hypothetical protein|tara:strand:+ start:149 stop:379 length:231 start_codon:yes stop_codon:yes gene_type:complete
MASQAMVGWACSAIVLAALLAYITIEVVKRWRVGLRIVGLDEGLLDDDGVSVEVITDAPKGSIVSPGMAVVPLEED